MDLNVLNKIGLSAGEISVYKVLLENGELPAQRIIELSGLKKGDCYNKLYDLEQKGLVEEFEISKKKHFRLTHPNHVETFVEAQEQVARQNKKELQALMPAILSTFNLSYHQPGVKIFEGETAIDILFKDSLSAKSNILAYIDLESIDKHLGKRATWYTKNRLKLGLNKYNLIFDSPYNRNVVKRRPINHTFERLIDLGKEMNGISLQIYDNKIVYHNLDPKATIGVIIEDKIISNLQKQIWHWMWNRAENSP